MHKLMDPSPSSYQVSPKCPRTAGHKIIRPSMHYVYSFRHFQIPIHIHGEVDGVPAFIHAKMMKRVVPKTEQTNTLRYDCAHPIVKLFSRVQPDGREIPLAPSGISSTSAAGLQKFKNVSRDCGFSLSGRAPWIVRPRFRAEESLLEHGASRQISRHGTMERGGREFGSPRG